MASGGVDVSQLIAFTNQMRQVRDGLPQFLEMFITKMAYRTLANTKRITPVDTGELRNKWEVSNIVVTATHVEASIINPQEYASWVEDGHWQRRRWLPGRWVGGRFVYTPYAAGSASSGIMLREKWIPGHYMARISLNKIRDEIPVRFQREFNAWVTTRLGG